MTNNHSQARNRLLYVCIMYFFPFTNTNSRNNQIKICHEQMVAMKPLMQYQKQCSAGYLNSPQCANHLLSALYDLQCCYLKLKWKKKNELKLFSYRLFFFKSTMHKFLKLQDSVQTNQSAFQSIQRACAT